jgi:hypothetical protein
MPKPKKNEIYATYNNDFCYEKGLSALSKMAKEIEIQPLDSHTIKILLKKKNAEVENEVKSIVANTKGYVEIELDTINALRVPKKRDNSGVLDTPFYG